MSHLLKYPAHVPGEKLIIRLDPTTLQASNCEQWFEYHNLMGMMRKKKDHIPEYGSALHLTAAELQRGVFWKDARDAGIKYFQSLDLECDWRNEMHLFKTLVKYCVRYQQDSFTPMKKDGVIGVEMPWCLPLLVTDHVEILLSGVIDAVGMMNNLVCYKDIKVTATWDSDKFMEKYRQSVQMKIYAYALRTMGYCDYYPPAIIDGVFLKNDTTYCELKRSNPLTFEDIEIEETMDWVHDIAARLADRVATGKFFKNSSCCNLYDSGCTFKGLCWGTSGMKGFERNKFIQREYNPSEFGGPVKEWKQTITS